MTVCISIDSDPHTVLLTDCLVTMDGGHETMTPASAGITHRRNNMPLAILVSKFGRLDGDSIVGFAGPASRIASFFEDFPNNYRLGLNQERPMRWASGLVNDFNTGAMSPENEISMIGFHARRVGENDERHWVRREGTPGIETELGNCFAIGSGAGELLNKILQFDSNYCQEEGANNSDLRLISAVGALNTQMLLSPSLDDLQKTWGGYYQVNGYTRNTQRWFHTPDWAHLGARIDLSETGFHCGIAAKFAFYRGGHSTSHLVVGAPIGADGETNHWPIRSGIGLRTSAEEENFVLQEFRPQFATIAFNIRYGERRWMRYTTLNGGLMENLILEFREGTNVSLGLRQEYFQFIADEEREYSRTLTA